MAPFLSDFSQSDQAGRSVFFLSHLACCKYIPVYLSRATIHRQCAVEAAETMLDQRPEHYFLLLGASIVK